MFENVNEVAVLVSAILGVAVGSIWYSPLLFGAIWMRSLGFTTEDDHMAKRTVVLTVVKIVIAQTVFFFGIAQFASYTFNSVISTMQVGVFLSILFFAQVFSSSIWERRPIAYALINVGYTILTLLGGLAIISYWPW